MNLSLIIMLISQLSTLTIKLIDEIQKVSGLNEDDKETLKKSVREMMEKVAAIKWEDT